MSKPMIVVRLSRGRFSQDYEVAIPMSECMIKDLCEPLELSDKPFSLLIHSLPMGRDYVKARKAAIRLRESTAQDIADEVRRALLKAFGANDKEDGYAIAGRG